MHIYSRKIIRFVQQIISDAKAILRDELRVKVSGCGFYDPAEKYRYPLSVVIFNDQSKLGYFNPEFLELGFHECLMDVSRDQLKNIIRHELAHYMIFLKFGDTIRSHGSEFRTFCQSVGWGEEVFRATTTLDFAEAILTESRVLQRVKKLLALSSSTNSHEAELAMVKAQQLLLRHNIDSIPVDVESADEEKMVLKRILKQRKSDAHMRAIAAILQTFFVSVVFSRAGPYTYLEILGTATNVQIADYVCDYLRVELDALWKKAAREHNLKGVVAKNCFLLGIAKGYCAKIERLNKGAEQAISNALMVIEKQLEEAKSMAYRSLRYSTSQSMHCPLSSSLGKQAGNSLTINPAISRPDQATTGLLC